MFALAKVLVNPLAQAFSKSAYYALQPFREFEAHEAISCQ